MKSAGEWRARGNEPTFSFAPRRRPRKRSFTQRLVGNEDGAIFWSTRNELFYSANGQVMLAPWTVENDTFRPGKPRLWSTRKITDMGLPASDIAPDGKRVVAVLDGEDSKPETHLRVMLHVVDELTRRESEGK
jgi:hypothetical protein